MASSGLLCCCVRSWQRPPKTHMTGDQSRKYDPTRCRAHCAASFSAAALVQNVLLTDVVCTSHGKGTNHSCTTKIPEPCHPPYPHLVAWFQRRQPTYCSPPYGRVHCAQVVHRLRGGHCHGWRRRGELLRRRASHRCAIAYSCACEQHPRSHAHAISSLPFESKFSTAGCVCFTLAFGQLSKVH